MTDRKKAERPGAPADEASRRAIREDLGTTILVEAAAGTGKTRSLVERMVALVAIGKTTVDRLCAVTFTIRAAGQLKQRFQSALEETLRKETHSGRRERLVAGLSAIDLCFVGTIHAFAARLLRERPVEAGIDPGFSEMDEPENGAARQEAWDRFVERLFLRADARLARLIELGVRLNDLSESFEAICENSDVDPARGPRAPEPDFSSAREQVAAFLQRAAASIPNTVPPGGWNRFEEGVRRAGRLSQLLDPRRSPDFVEILRVLKVRGVLDDAGAFKKPLDRLREDVLKPALARWAEYVYPDVMALLTEARDEFAAWRRRNGRANFQDLLLLARDLLRDHAAVRAALFERFTPILVDEFQDTDPIQAEILFYLTGCDREETEWKRLAPIPGSLFVVGDPKQSIYRFRRADIQTYQTVRKTIEACGRVLRLSTNFRSSPQVCDWINETFARPAFFGVEPTEEQAAYVPLVSALGPGPAGPVAFRLEAPATGSSDLPAIQADSARIADFIAAAIDSGRQRAEDFLVLFRRRKFMTAYARALEERGVVADLGGGSAFGSSEDLASLMPLLQTLADPDNPVALVAALRGPLFGVDDDALYRLARDGGRFHFRSELPAGADARIQQAYGLFRLGEELARRLPPAAAIARFFERLGAVALAGAQSLGDSRAGNLVKALAAARKFSAQGMDFSAVVREIDGLRRQDSVEQMSVEPGRGGAVRLLTIHAAKGLEAPVVFLAEPGRETPMTANFFVDRSVAPPAGYFRVARRTVGFGEEELARPPGWDDMQEIEKRFDEAERIRLLYVAATRAGRMLGVSVRRNKDGRATGAWEKLDRYLTSSLPEAARRDPAAVSAEEGDPERDLEDFRQRRAQAGARIALPTYRTASVTAVAHSEAARPAWEHTGKGMGWGRVLHGLLEASMKDPAIDLSACAANLLAEEGRSPGEVEEAVRLVEGVRSSGLWRRALASRRCLVEVPFALTAPVEESGDRGTEEGLLTGAIDLVFEEADAWVVIDYKSDIVGDNRAALVDFYRPQVSRYRRYWENLTGRRTRAGLYFIQTGEEVWID